MTEYLKAIPHPDTERVTVEMDRAGFEVLKAFYTGDPEAKDRVWGILFAATSQMGWVN